MPEFISDGSPTQDHGGGQVQIGSSLSNESQNSNSPSNPRIDIEFKFCETLDAKYECKVCCEVLHYPKQFECGHRCCTGCLREVFRSSSGRCPVDQNKIEEDEVHTDKACQQEIDRLSIKCCLKGCKWNGCYNERSTHYEVCKYRTISCPRKCGTELQKGLVDKHLTEDCTNRGVVCEFCKQTVVSREEIEHLNVCELMPIPCPNGCKKKEIPRGEMEDHMDNKCPKQSVPCPFVEAGCQYRCNRKKLTAHTAEESIEHVTLLNEAILKHTDILHDQRERIEEQVEQFKALEGRVDTLEKLYGSQLVWKIDNYSDKLEEAKSGSKRTIFSPPFLTSRHGYKMALSACLFGDGKARGKFMSVFCCICRGEYDALLLWPFCHRVTLTLIDQCQDPSARRNVTYTVKPNTCKDNKPFLGRPSGDRNASFGAQKFVELEVLDTLDYVRDDTIFIKVNVESEDMVKL